MTQITQRIIKSHDTCVVGLIEARCYIEVMDACGGFGLDKSIEAIKSL